MVREEGEGEEGEGGDVVVLGLIPLVFMTLSMFDTPRIIKNLY